MKQYISEEQLNELTWGQQSKLACLIYGNTIPAPIDGNEVTIGKMIKLLAEQKDFVHFTVWDSKSETRGIKYQKIAIVDGAGEDCSMVQHESEEICDALWEAVKTIL